VKAKRSLASYAYSKWHCCRRTILELFFPLQIGRAIHQHMTHEQPRMMFLHYWGRGQAAALANAIKVALSLTKS